MRCEFGGGDNAGDRSAVVRPPGPPSTPTNVDYAVPNSSPDQAQRAEPLELWPMPNDDVRRPGPLSNTGVLGPDCLRVKHVGYAHIQTPCFLDLTCNAEAEHCQSSGNLIEHCHDL